MLLRSGSAHAFTALLVLVVRPAAVFVATNRTRMAVRERLFAAFFAPRGIVAAGVAGLFGRAISAAGVPGAELVMNVTYEVILVTVALAAVGASPMARILRVSAPAKQGVLIVGCHQFGRSLGSALKAAGVPVMLVDTNPANCRRAQRLELPSVCGSATDERVLEDLDFPEMGTILALTTNEEVNTLVCEWGKETVGPRSTYQARLETSDSLSAASRAGLGGLTAFAQKLPLNAISAALAENRAEILTAQAHLSDLMTGDEMSHGLDLGDYLLGWIVKGSFKVHTPDAKPEPQEAAVYLRVASTA